jgi:hypothetical protein
MRKTRDWMLGLPPGITAPGVKFVWRDPRIDALIDGYVDWREECETVEAAYERWTASARSEHGLAYAAYRAALEREEKAAKAYQLAATRLVGATRVRRQS